MGRPRTALAERNKGFALARDLARFTRIFVIKHDLLSLNKLRGQSGKISRFYDFFAPFYDFIYPQSKAFAAATQKLVDTCVYPKDRVLDIGTGTGILSQKMSHLASRVDAFDLHRKMLKKARKNLLRYARRYPGGCQTALVQGNAVTLPFRQGAFDLIVSSFCFVYLSHEQKATTLAECYRTLADGGRVALLTSRGEFSKRYCTVAEWEDLLGDAGFRDARFENVFDIFRLLYIQK